MHRGLPMGHDKPPGVDDHFISRHVRKERQAQNIAYAIIVVMTVGLYVWAFFEKSVCILFNKDQPL